MEKLEIIANVLFNKIFENDNLGNFEIILRECGPSSNYEFIYYKTIVNIVFKHNEDDNCRMPVIIVEKDGNYQDFYYNESDYCWKQLTEENLDKPNKAFNFVQSWDIEEVCYTVNDNDILPEKFENIKASGVESILDSKEILDI